MGERAQTAAAVINIVERGAVADSGVTDNLSIINQAIRDAYDAGGGQVLVPAAATDTAYYAIGGAIRMLSGVQLVGQGVRSFIKSTVNNASNFHANDAILAGTYGPWVEATEAVAETAYDINDITVRGSRTVTLSSSGDAAHFPVGTPVALRASAENAGGFPLASMVNLVTSVSGETLTFLHRIPDTYGTTTGTKSKIRALNVDPDSAGMAGIDGQRAYLLTKARIANLRIEVSTAGGAAFRGQGIHFSCYDCEFENLWVRGGTGAMSGNPCAFTRVNNVTLTAQRILMELAYLSNNTRVTGVRGARLGSPNIDSFAPAIYLSAEGCADTVVDGFEVSNFGVGAHASLTIGGRRCWFRNGTLRGTQDSGAGAGMDAYARGGGFRNVSVIGPSQYGFTASTGAQRWTWDGCNVQGSPSGYEAYRIQTGANAGAAVRNCSAGDPSAPNAQDCIRDDNYPDAPTEVTGSVTVYTRPKQVSTAFLTHTGSTSATTVRTYTIPAGGTHVRSGFRLTAVGNVPGASTAGTKNVVVKLGATTLGTITFGAGETGFWSFDLLVIAGAATNSQTVVGSIRKGSTVSGIGTVTGIDLSVGSTITLEYTLSSTSDSIYTRLWMVEPINDQSRSSA